MGRRMMKFDVQAIESPVSATEKLLQATGKNERHKPKSNLADDN
jgi:hypothetical protein